MSSTLIGSRIEEEGGHDGISVGRHSSPAKGEKARSDVYESLGEEWFTMAAK